MTTCKLCGRSRPEPLIDPTCAKGGMCEWESPETSIIVDPGVAVDGQNKIIQPEDLIDADFEDYRSSYPYRMRSPKPVTVVQVCGLLPLLLEPCTSGYLTCDVQRPFKPRLLYLVGSPGVLIEAVMVGNCCQGTDSQPIPIEFFEERNPVTGMRGREQDYHAASPGVRMTVQARNPTDSPALISGCFEGLAIVY